MRHRIQTILIASLGVATITVAAADRRPVGGVSAPNGTQAPAGRRMIGPAADGGVVAARVAKLRHARDVLQRLAASPLPQSLTPAERSEAARYNAWLRDAAMRLDALASRGQLLRRSDAAATSLSAQRQMQEMNRRFNIRYLQIAQKIQQENRQFTMISNIMKNKHDAAKNTINNIR